MFRRPDKVLTHYNVVVSTNNGTSEQTVANEYHVAIFLSNCFREENPGRIVIIIDPVYS